MFSIQNSHKFLQKVKIQIAVCERPGSSAGRSWCCPAGTFRREVSGPGSFL